MTISRSATAWQPWVGGALVAAAFLWTYASTIRKLVDHWAASDMYSYGFLVPVVSGGLLWLRRDVLRSLPVAPSYRLGTAMLGAAIAMLIVGQASSTILVEELSLPIAIAGSIVLVLGRRMTVAMTFPLVYLLAMIPFWDFLTAPLQAPFQLYSATMGVAAMRLFDLPVLQEGVLIYLPSVTLEVAEVCSGVNQLVAILCLGIPLAHLRISSWPRRALVVIAAVMIALLSNGLRVAMISLFAYYGVTGPDGDVHGPYSMLRTTLISAVGFGMLFWLVARFSDRRDDSDLPRQRPFAGPGVPGRFAPRAVAVALALFASAAAFEHWHDVVPVPAPRSAGFPAVIGRWRVVSQGPAFANVEAVGFDSAVTRRYVAPDGSEVDLLVGYFERQRQGRELVGFEVSRLLSTASGHSIQRLSNDLRVKDFVTSIDRDQYHVTYVYMLNGEPLAESYEAKWRLTWNALARRRTNGGIVVVRSRVDGSAEHARTKTRDFIEGAVAESSRFLPG